MARIVELRVKNFQRISAISIRPDGTLNVITGCNDQGKSSLLLAIWSLFKMKAAPAVVIREGEEQCTLYADIGEFKVTRTFTRKNGAEVTHKLTIKTADGMTVPQPQSMLDLLAPSDIAFDPLAFTRWDSKKQYAALQQLVKGFDFAATAAARLQIYEDRTRANVAARQWRDVAMKVTLPPGPEPAAVDVTAKAAEMQAASEANAKLAREQARRRAMQQEASRLSDEAETLRAQADAADERAAGIRKGLAEMEPLGTPVDLTTLTQEIEQAQATSRVRDLFAKRREAEREAETHEAVSEAFSRRIRELDEAKLKAIAEAKMPVDGLGFDDEKERITLNGVPFAQAGQAVKIRTAAAILMALNPELRIMTIDGSEALDAASLAALDAMCGDQWQLFMTKVIANQGEGGGDYEIVDGHLAGGDA